MGGAGWGGGGSLDKFLCILRGGGGGGGGGGAGGLGGVLPKEPLPLVLNRQWSMRLRRAGGAILHEKIVRPPPPPHPSPVPWTLNVYSARALCFLGFSRKPILKLGSRFGTLMRRAFYWIALEGSDGMNFDGRPRTAETTRSREGVRNILLERDVVWGGVDHAWRLTDG